jgi:hypothetical protein
MTDRAGAARLVERRGARQPARHRRTGSVPHAPVSVALVSAPADGQRTSTAARMGWQNTATQHGRRRHVSGAARGTGEIEVITIDPRLVEVVDQAEREHYRITRCAACGGAEVHAKLKPAAKCLRCGTYRTLERITPPLTRQRCGRCQATFWAVLKTTTSEKCRGKWGQEGEIDVQPVRVVRR